MAQTSIPLFKVFMPETAHAALKPVLESGRLATGPQVAKFESALAAWFGVSGVVALNDASGGLTLALYLAGVRPGDEVITSPLACAATAMPIANLFARPVWCDVDPHTGMIDPAQIDRHALSGCDNVGSSTMCLQTANPHFSTPRKHLHFRAFIDLAGR